MLFGFKTDKGMRRDVNEDSLFVMPAERIFMVADGVGGHNSGEVASSMTVSYIAEQIREVPPDTIEDDGGLKKYFTDMLKRINFKVYRQAKSQKENYGMATTLVMIYFRGDNAYVINVGDSRAYLLRDGELRQITDDHTYVNGLVKRGVMTKEEAMRSADRNMITRAVGAELEIMPDFIMFRVYPGDRFLLCSDGLYDEVEDREMEAILSGDATMIDIAAGLVDRANEYGGRDNITAVAVAI